ncbi:hypothetical protein JCM30237_16990 [Halolamina litorea]|uniref:Mechanosensitive ion channel family protein n=1 Tax=Halolamina litorea TaxID=1515593 RepID=A0ABD6BS92_9EURY|nr:mechanosensitive ion channel family protein [Halolamina litorea]
MILSVADAVFSRLPVEPSALGTFFDSALEFLFGFLMVYLVARYAVKPVLRWLLKYRRIVVEPAVRQLVVQVVEVTGFIVGVWVGLHFADANSIITGTATIISAGTLAVGVASRDIISNLTNGLFLIADPQFEVGDWVEWSDNEGIVEEVGIRVSRVRTFENRTIVVPNSELGNSAITNHNDKDRIKVVVPIGVGYDEDLEIVKRVAVAEALKIPSVMKNPMPGVSVTGLGASWVDMKLAVWIDTSDHDTMVETRDDLVSRIKSRFGKENISMPYETTAIAGQMQVANIDSDKLSPEEETKIDHHSEVELPVDPETLDAERKKQDVGVAETVTETLEEAVDFDDGSGAKTETKGSTQNGHQKENGQQRNGNGEKRKEATQDLSVGQEKPQQAPAPKGSNGNDAPDPPDKDEDEDGNN